MGISTFGPYRLKYIPRLPQKPLGNADEQRLLNDLDGVRMFSDAPYPVREQDMNSSARNPDENKRCLWVIRQQDVPFILEHANVLPPLASGRCKHTNLTGGSEARCGGEVWFVSSHRLILNGASGRYPPGDAGELQDVTNAFEGAGYEVWSMGWDEEIDRPARVPKGIPPWVVQR